MARWTDLAQWRGPTINEGDGDGTPGEAADHLVEVRGLVVHIAQGSYEGTISWQRNPAADVSSHFVVSRDGRIAQVVDTDDRAWTQRAGNSRWLSVENEGFVPHPLSAAQVEANAQLLARIHLVYGVPLQVATSPAGRGLGHHSMGPDWGHQDCPGPAIIAQKPAIVTRAIQIITGGGTVAVAGLTDVQARELHDLWVWVALLASDPEESRGDDRFRFPPPFKRLRDALQQLLDRPPVTVTDAQALAMADRIGDRLAQLIPSPAEYATVVAAALDGARLRTITTDG